MIVSSPNPRNQVSDDYMNLSSELYAQQRGFWEDLNKGKISYLVVHCCSQSPQFHENILWHVPGSDGK